MYRNTRVTNGFTETATNLRTDKKGTVVVIAGDKEINVDPLFTALYSKRMTYSTYQTNVKDLNILIWSYLSTGFLMKIKHLKLIFVKKFTSGL